nr:MAG TPA: hypothetical protein [Caudoviricetes sp.]
MTIYYSVWYNKVYPIGELPFFPPFPVRRGDSLKPPLHGVNSVRPRCNSGGPQLINIL